MKIKNDVIKRHEKIKKALEIIEENNGKFPEGNLSIKGKDHVERFHEYRDKEGNKKCEYIKKKDTKLAHSLAMKGYYQKMKKCLSAEEKAMARFLKDYHPEKKYQLYDEMKDARKALVTPLFESVQEKVDEWRSETYETGTFHPESLKHESAKGERMRSKSEVIIAGMINEYPELEYRYEKPLDLIRGGATIKPDFTIINTRTGKIYYLEHIGMLSVAEYAEGFIWKMNAYTKNGYRMGVDVFFTFESAESGIDMVATRKIIEYLTEGD